MEITPIKIKENFNGLINNESNNRYIKPKKTKDFKYKQLKYEKAGFDN